MKGEKMQEKELKKKITSESSEMSEEENPEKNQHNDEEDILYTHKPENRDSSLRWNSTFCRRPGH